MSISGTIAQTIRFSLDSTHYPTVFPLQAFLPKLDRSYSQGTGANQVDGIHCAPYSLAATSTTLDLSALTDPNGDAITCTTGRVRELVVQNTSSYKITLGAAASNAWGGMLDTGGGTLDVPPNGTLHFSDPTTVGAGAGAVVTATSKALKIDAGANTVTFNLLIAMCSAQS